MSLKSILFLGLGLVVPNEGQQLVATGRRKVCTGCQEILPTETLVYKEGDSILCVKCEAMGRGKRLLRGIVDAALGGGEK